MIFDHTPAFDEWFEEANRELAAARRGGTVKTSLAAVESGLVDFKNLVPQTRQKMQTSYEKGQALGNSRKGAAKSAATKRKAKK